jgi:hypothetical protein
MDYQFSSRVSVFFLGTYTWLHMIESQSSGIPFYCLQLQMLYKVLVVVAAVVIC